MNSVLIMNPIYQGTKNSKKYNIFLRFSTYVSYQKNHIHRNIPPDQHKTPSHDNNSKNATFNETYTTDPSESYHRRVAHAQTIKVVNNRYFTDVTLKFCAVTKEKNVNIAEKHVIIFATIKLLDPPATVRSIERIIY